MKTVQEVHPSDIENQLVKIWDSLQGKNKMRACLFNLIIYSKKDARQSYLQSVARRVVKRFPCRILFMTDDCSSQENSLKSYVSVMSADEGESAIFCDLIEVELLGKECAKTPFLILPHILPDLPIYVVWGDDPSKNPALLFKLEELASKTIFDSETAHCLPEFASSVFFHKQKTESDIIDLNWARIEGWRNLLASIFYCPDKMQMLARAERIDISYNDTPTDQFQKTNIQSIYLQAWIAATMKWKLKNQEGNKYIYQNGDKHIVIELTPEVTENIKPGRIISVKLESENEECFHFVRDAHHPHIANIHYSNKSLCETPSQFLFGNEESGQSLSSEIFHRGTSKHFLKALKVLEEGVCKDD